MSRPAASKTEASDREIVTTRVIDAPRERLFRAWTDPAQLPIWWGPNGFTTTTKACEVRPGGGWVYTMHGPDGKHYPNKSVFLEVVQPERIVYSHGWDAPGAFTEMFQATWTFEAQGEKTNITARSVFPSAEARDYVVKQFRADEGGQQNLARLAAYLPTMR